MRKTAILPFTLSVKISANIDILMTQDIVELEKQEVEQKVPKKRGRKPKNKGYFVEEQEEAFREFLLCEDKHKKNQIFSKQIYPALSKMIECLIRRYYLFSVDESYEDTFYDTMGHLMTKIRNFKPDIGKKAYSYCGTICKRYLILKRTQSMKKREKFLSYEALYPGSEKDNRVEEKGTDTIFLNKLIDQTKDEIHNILDSGRTKKRNLNANEIKVGNALLEILEHWEDMVDDERSRKFQKMSLLYFIKEYSLCNTTEVRNALKIYKNAYLFTKKCLLNE